MKVKAKDLFLKSTQSQLNNMAPSRAGRAMTKMLKLGRKKKKK